MPSATSPSLRTRLGAPAPHGSSASGKLAADPQARVLEIRAESRELLARLKALVDEAAKSEDPVGALAGRILSGTPPATVARQADLRSRAIAEFLGRHALLSAVEVDRLGGRPPSSSNPAARASRWKRERRIFAVRWQGGDRFPAFQFAAGEPIPDLREILALLGRTADGWGEALWFASPHAYLEGRAPSDLLLASASGESRRALEAARWQYGPDAA